MTNVVTFEPNAPAPTHHHVEHQIAIVLPGYGRDAQHPSMSTGARPRARARRVAVETRTLVCGAPPRPLAGANPKARSKSLWRIHIRRAMSARDNDGSRLSSRSRNARTRATGMLLTR